MTPTLTYSAKDPAIRSASREAFLSASLPVISKSRAPVTAFLGLTTSMSRSEKLIALLANDIASPCENPECSFVSSATAPSRMRRRQRSAIVEATAEVATVRC
jgi:hypothetical protein